MCAENEKDRGRLIGTVTEEKKTFTPVKVAPAVLAQYVGTYDWRWPENPTIPSLWSVTLMDGALYMVGAPMVPISETQFLWADSNRIEFVKDAQGRVTHFTAIFVEGNMVAKKVR